MKRFLLSSLILLLIGCGQSDQEKLETAIVTCNIMGESRNMDAAMRIREINSARESIGEDAYLGTDSGIVEAFEYDLCPELVLNDPEYSAKLFERQEAERIAREDREEAERIAREEREEAERIAREAERIAREEREEAERLAILQSQQDLTNSILSVFEDYPPSFSNGRITRRDIDIEGFTPPIYNVEFSCVNSKGLARKVTIQFEGDLGAIEGFDSIGYCNDGLGENMFLQIDLSAELLDIYQESLSAFVSKVQRITVEWTGQIYRDGYEENFSTNVEARDMSAKVDSTNFGGVDPDLSRLPHTWVIYEKE